MKTFIIAFFGLCVFLLNTHADEPRLTILMYHGFSDKTSVSLYQKRIESFYADMEYIQNHFDVIPLRDVKDVIDGKKTLSRNSIVLTFDDGRDCNYSLAAPILEEFGFAATFFIITNFCDQEDFMTWKQITDLSQRLDKQGNPLFEIGSHTCSHVDMSKFSEEELKKELEDSKKALLINAGVSCVSLALPYGVLSGDPTLINVAKNLGYENIRTSDRGNVVSASDLYALPCLPLYDFTPPEYIGAFNQDPTLEMPFFDPVQDINIEYDPLIDSYTVQAEITGIFTYLETKNDFISIEATPEDPNTITNISVEYTPPQEEGKILITTKPGHHESIRINVRVDEAASHYSCGYFYIHFKSAVTGVKDNINETAFIYPNPVTDWLEIKNAGDQPLYKVYNASGQTVLTGQSRMLNVASLPAGVYIINIYSEGKNIKLRFVKAQK